MDIEKADYDLQWYLREGLLLEKWDYVEKIR